MKLLIITHSYTPDLTPRAFRWSSIAQYWASQGHQIDIVCAGKPRLLKNESRGDVRIFRVGDNVTNFFRDKFREVKLETTTVDQFNKSKNTGYKKKLKSVIKILHDMTWKKIYWPDSVCLWYFPAVAMAKNLIKREKYDALVSVSLPFTGHLVGLSLKSAFPSLFWLVDIGDPFCFLDETPTNNHKLYQKLNFNIERKIFRGADVIAVTNRPTLKKYIDLFPETKAKVHIIPPLTLIPVKKLPDRKFLPKGEKVRLIYTGTLYKKIRNPRFLLLLFQKLLQTDLAPKLELHFYGEVNDCEDCFEPYHTLLGAKLFVNRAVAQNEILKVIDSADILVNIGNSTSYQLSSKLAEYMSVGKPILNMVSNLDDCSLEFLSGYPLVFNFVINNGLIDAAQLENLRNFIKNLPPPVDAFTLEKLLKPFRLDTVGEGYKTLLKLK